MFNQLRNKLLMLNLIIISVMMIIAFSTIYLITYRDVSKSIDAELHKISDFNRKPTDIPMEPKPNIDRIELPQDRSISFTLIIDNSGEITSSFSVFQMDDDFYENAKSTALLKDSLTGKFKLDGEYWAFIKKPYYEGSRIVFLDITSRQGILTNLIYTFLIVAAIMLFVIFFISRFFANKSIKPIKEAFYKQKQFIGDASHELKTPLAVINTNVEVLLSNGKETINSQSKWLNYIKSEVERMTKLTNDLLYLTQIDYSDSKTIYSNINLSDTVESVILTMEALIFENHITFDYCIEPNLKIYGNVEQVKQVVMILLDNAIKYTNNKGSITLNLEKTHNNIILVVTNTGIGVSEEHIDKIFDRLYRVDKARSRNIGGYGLGLSIAKAIVEQHGGKISVKSIKDVSTTFTIEWPRNNS